MRDILQIIDNNVTALRLVKKQATNRLKETEQGLSDLNHFLELHNLDAVKMVKMAKAQKILLQERRKAKDTIIYVGNLMGNLPVKNTLTSQYDSAVKGNKNRKYTPRQLSLDILS